MKKKNDYRILIAEDNQAMRRIMETMLSGLGYENSVLAVHGAEAWEIIQEEDVDIILCDLIMPEMNGLELLNLIRSSKKYFNLPFIMVTGVEDKSEFMKTVRAEVDHYIIKPPSAQKLGNMLKNVIRSITSPSTYEKAVTTGKYYLLHGDLDKSLQTFEIAEKVKSDAAQPLFYKGLIYDKKGDITKAALNYKKALTIESNYINALNGLATIYKKKKDYEKLLSCLNRTAEIAPASFDVSLSIGIALAETNDMHKAAENFKEALRLARNNPQKLTKLLEAYIDTGMIDEADELFGRKFQDEDDGKTVAFWNRLALNCMRLGLHDKARLLYLSALKLDPQNKPVNYNLAKLLYRQHDVESAQAYLQKILRLYPDFKEASELQKKMHREG